MTSSHLKIVQEKLELQMRCPQIGIVELLVAKRHLTKLQRSIPLASVC